MTVAAKNLLQASSMMLVAFFTGQLIPKSHANLTQSTHQVGTVGYNEMKTVVNTRAAVIIDARSRHNFQAGHIPTAISLPANSDAAAINKTLLEINDPHKLVVVYCSDAGCQDSNTLAIKLSQAGHNNTSIYKEGWEEWQILEPTN